MCVRARVCVVSPGTSFLSSCLLVWASTAFTPFAEQQATQTHKQTNNQVSAIVNPFSCGPHGRARLVLRLTLAVGLGLEDVKHDDENDGDGHDEDGWHGDDESCSQMALAGGICSREEAMVENLLQMLRM